MQADADLSMSIAYLLSIYILRGVYAIVSNPMRSYLHCGIFDI